MIMRMMRNNHAFTLFEILIAMMLLAAIGVTALSSISNSTRMVSGKQNTATNLARQKLEDLKNAVANTPWTQAGQLLTPGTPGAALQPPAATLDNVTFNQQYVVSIVDVDGDGLLEDDEPRRVTTTVTWTPL